MMHDFSSGAVVFTVENGVRKYLLVTENAGHTGFPKGHLEAGETTLEAAMREIWEETGIVPQIIDGFCEELSFELAPGVEKHVTFYLAQYDHQPIAPMEHQVKEAMLLPLKEALCALTHENTREILCRADTYLDTINR